MSTSQKRRTRFSSAQSPDYEIKPREMSGDAGLETAKPVLSGEKDICNEGNAKLEASHQWPQFSAVLGVANALLGLVGMVVISGLHSWLIYQLHENNLWFTNIKVLLQSYYRAFNLDTLIYKLFHNNGTLCLVDLYFSFVSFLFYLEL